MEIFDAIRANLLSPAVLFFALGVSAALMNKPPGIPLLETMRKLLAELIEARLDRIAGKSPLLHPMPCAL